MAHNKLYVITTWSDTGHNRSDALALSSSVPTACVQGDEVPNDNSASQSARGSCFQLIMAGSILPKI